MSIDKSFTPKSSTDSFGSTDLTNIDPTKNKVEPRIRFENGSDVDVTPSDNHIDVNVEDVITRRDAELRAKYISDDPNTTRALKPLRDNKLSLVRGKGAFLGAGVGLLGGGAAGGLKLAAIGAGIGTLVMPGIGTAIGAVVGGVVGLVGGAVVGGGAGGLIGHFVGKQQAAKIDILSITKEHAFDTPKFNAILGEAGISTKYWGNDALGFDRDLADLLKARGESGKPIGNALIRKTVTSLARFYDNRIAQQRGGRAWFDALQDLYRHPGLARQDDLAMAASVLADIQSDTGLSQNGKDAAIADVVQKFREGDWGARTETEIWRDVSRYMDIARAKDFIDHRGQLDNAGKQRVKQAVDQIMQGVPTRMDGKKELDAVMHALVRLNRTNGLSPADAQLATDALVKYAHGRLADGKPIDPDYARAMTAADRGRAIQNLGLQNLANSNLENASFAPPDLANALAAAFAAIAGDQTLTESEKRNALDGIAQLIAREFEYDKDELGKDESEKKVTENEARDYAQQFLNVETALRGIQSASDIDEEKWLALTGDGQPPLEDLTEDNWNDVKAAFRKTAAELIGDDNAPVVNENTNGYRDLLGRVAKQVLAPNQGNDET
jgi:hypothetical protein